jgi:hypothetical protein
MAAAPTWLSSKQSWTNMDGTSTQDIHTMSGPSGLWLFWMALVAPVVMSCRTTPSAPSVMASEANPQRTHTLRHLGFERCDRFLRVLDPSKAAYT